MQQNEINDKIPLTEIQAEECNDPPRNGGKNMIRFLIHCLGLTMDT
jgi:hypothetical protein